MTKSRWHILRDDSAVTLCRSVPPRFDVSAVTILEGGSATRLAHQIRQDMWRALQDVRGFSPVVRLERCDANLGWSVTAGGRICGRPAPSLGARIRSVLEDPANRDRWTRFARTGGRA